MKSATITWITYNNYGTELQAYALQQYLYELGIENDIVSDYHIVTKQSSEETVIDINPVGKFDHTVLVSFSKRLKQFLKKSLTDPTLPFTTIWKRICYKWYVIQSRITGKKHKKAQNILESNAYRQEQFKKEHLSIKYGYKVEDIRMLNQEYELFICGSDQIWSVLDHNFNGYFYMDFVNKKKISYAASIGTNKISEDKAKQIRKWLESFSAISVREKSTARILTELTAKNIAWVCDPTLLYDSIFWRKFSEGTKTPSSKYLLCYFLSNRKWYFDYAKKLAKHMKLKLIVIPTTVEQAEKKCSCQNAIGPKEFVSYIKDAEFVLTDSYHGSIFCMQFNRNFLYLKRFLDTDYDEQNIRIYSLFERLNLHNLIISEKPFSSKDIKNIDFNEVNQYLADFRTNSREYLRTAVKI